MPGSIEEYLREDMACEDLLECIHGLKRLDRRCYRTLVSADEPMTVDAVAEVIDRERSTAYRSIQRLLEAGLIEQRQETHDDGGYHHAYVPADPDLVADRMQRLLNDWYAHLGQLIAEFRRKYDGEASGEREGGVGGDSSTTVPSGE